MTMNVEGVVPRLGGVTEVAAELGVSRQQVAKLRKRPDFPAPIAQLSAGDVWNLDSIARWSGSGLRRGAGRPTGTPLPVVGRRFELEEKIDEGGFAVVHRARDLEAPDVAERVAVKVLKRSDPDAVARFEREFTLMPQFDHPNLMRVLASGNDEAAGLWYAMPLALGNLADEIGAFPTPEEIAGVMRQICRGLAHLHDRGTIHRDLNPKNILRTREGEWAIADFGLARAVLVGPTLTATADQLGTLLYSAPEQLRDAKNTDERVDIFSLGKIMQALVIQENPVNDDVPPGPLQALIEQAIAHEQRHRFSSVTDLLTAIEMVLSPIGVWESTEELVDRLEPRLKAGRESDPAALDELVRRASEIDLDDYTEMGDFARGLSALPADSIQWWWAGNPSKFLTVFEAFTGRLGGAFDFTECDALADFAARAVASTGDRAVLRNAVMGLANLGHHHNRWHVRDVAVILLQGIRDPNDAMAALEGLRSARPGATDWTLVPSVRRTLHPFLRSAVESTDEIF